MIETKVKTSSEYFVRFEKNFTVFPDEKSILGFNCCSCKLQVEDTSQKDSLIQIGENHGFVFTVLFHEKLDTFLAGYSNGRVIQYKKITSGFWKS